MSKSSIFFQFFFLTYVILFTLTPSCSTSDSTNVDNWVVSKINVKNVTYGWTIQNFSQLNIDAGESLQSPFFSTGAAMWFFNFFPNGWMNKTFTSLMLQSTSYKSNQFVTCDIFLLNKKTGSKFLPQSAKSCKQYDFVTRDDIANYLDDDELTIVAKVSVITINSTVNSKSCGLLSSSLDYHRTRNLEYLLDNDLFSDVKLKIGEHEIDAHRNILASVSPLFSKEFKKTRGNNDESGFEIKNVDYDLFKKVLRFAYTGEVEITEQVAKDLLPLAKRFEIEELQKICEEVLCQNLNSDNAPEIFNLAYIANATYLQAQALKYL